jgi:hypothetical protein
MLRIAAGLRVQASGNINGHFRRPAGQIVSKTKCFLRMVVICYAPI